MFNRFSYLLLVLFVIATGSCKRQETRQIPIIDFFKTPENSFFKISPDGRYISYLKPYKEKRNLFIKSLADGKERRVTSFGDYAVRDYNWTYNNQIIINIDIVPNEEFILFVVDIPGLKLRPLLTEKNARIRILNRNRQMPDIVTISMSKRDPTYSDIYKLNIKTGELKMYQQNPGNITDWFPDTDGKILLAKASDGVDEAILYRPNDQAPFRKIISNNFKNSVQPIAFTGVKTLFYALSNVGRDKAALVEIDAKTGKEERVIYANDKADLSECSYSRNKHRLEYAAWEEAKPQRHFLTNDVEQTYKELDRLLKGSQIRITSSDSSENKFIVATYTDLNPGSYYLYEQDHKKLTKLGDVSTTINPAELCSMQAISFKARDGLLINGYLTLPKNKNKTNLPVVVMPHNGPWRRESWGYNSEVQFLANRGYAVLQINYRGSTGYGKEFYSAGFKQLGGKMQDDITDGTKWLISQKIANPKKIALMGNGFGGFSALHGISFNPELYNCAVVQFGLINFFTFLKDAPPYSKPYLKMIYEKVGNPETDADLLRAISPVFHADKIKLPLIIFQGGKDPHANISELNQFYRELKRRNVPVTYILNNNERNFFRSERSKLQMYTEIEKFLSNNMRVKP